MKDFGESDMAGAEVALPLIFHWLVMLPNLTTKKAGKCSLVVFPRRRHGFRDQPAASATLLCNQSPEKWSAHNRCSKNNC